MKRIILVISLLLPLLAAAQGNISKQQSRQRLDALKRLQNGWNILSGGQYFTDLLVLDRNNHCGVVDLDGRTVIPFRYDWITAQTNNGLFALFQDTLVGFADRTGRIVIPLEYDAELYAESYGDIFYDEGIAMMSKGGKFGIIDTTGRIVVPFIYDGYLSPIADDRMIVQHRDYTQKHCSYTLSRFNGDTLIAPCRGMSWWDEGLLKVWNSDNLNGLYDFDGHVVVPCQYDYMSYPNHGLAAVRKDKRVGVIDRTGREVIPVAEDRFRGMIPDPQSANLFVVYNKDDDKFGAVDRWGKTVIPFEYDGSLDEASNNFLLERDGKSFLFDTLGRLLDSYDNWFFVYDCDVIGPLSVYPVCKGDRWGMVDSSWRLIVPCKYRSGEIIDANHCAFMSDDVTNCLIDNRGRVIFKGPYQSIYHYGDGLWAVSTRSVDGKDKIRGWVDNYGQTTLTRKQLRTMRQWMQQYADKVKDIPIEEVVEVLDEDFIPADTIEAVAANGDEDLDEVFVVVENYPEFPGGDSALFMYICMNLSYPDVARQNGIEGRVYVSFIVDKDGSIRNVKVLRDIGGGCGAAAVEMVKAMPRWKPGTQAGKPVRTQFTLPLNFQLEDEVQSADSKEQQCLFQFNNSGWKSR